MNKTHKFQNRPMTGPFPLKVPVDLQARIKQLARKSALSEADLMRQAIQRGLPALEDFYGKAA